MDTTRALKDALRAGVDVAEGAEEDEVELDERGVRFITMFRMFM